MKKAFIMIIIGFAIILLLIIVSIKAHYKYVNTISNYWTLADRASTISKKSEYIDKFVDVLEKSNLSGINDSLLFPTAETSFDSNFEALKSLKARLDKIKTMDESSFAYQTAIQQITAQEQGEAIDMLEVFKNCWLKAHYYYLWNFIIFGLLIITGLIPIFMGCSILMDN